MDAIDKIQGGERSRIEVLSMDQVNEVVVSSSNAYAQLIAGLMVSRATASDQMLIYSEDLSLPFYAEILRSSVCNIKILLDSAEGISVIRMLPHYIQDRIEYRLMEQHYPAHFLVVGNSLRLTEHEKNELHSSSNFCDPKSAAFLRGRFDFYWEESVPCAVPV